LTIEQEGHLSEQAGRVSEQGGQLSDVPSLTFPGWVPPPVIEAATELNEKLAKEKDPALAQVLLSRLVRLRMRREWQHFDKKLLTFVGRAVSLTNARPNRWRYTLRYWKPKQR
jgi:hypothetical protein